MQLAEKEKEEVRKVARGLLETLKREKLVLDWRKKQQERAKVLTAVRDILDRGLPLREATCSKRRASWQVIWETRPGWLINDIVARGTLLRTLLRRSLSQRGVGRVWLVYLLRPM